MTTTTALNNTFGFFKKQEVVATYEMQDNSQGEKLEDWDHCDIEDIPAEKAGPGTPSSSDSKRTKSSCSRTDGWDSDASTIDTFEEVSHLDATPVIAEDLQQIHAVHVAGTHNHIVPPYRIEGDTANLLCETFHPNSPQGRARRAKLQADYEKFLKEDEAEADPQYEHWQLREVELELKDCRKGLRVVHLRGYTGEMLTGCSVYDDVVCDETCPQFSNSVAKQISRTVQSLKNDWAETGVQTQSLDSPEDQYLQVYQPSYPSNLAPSIEPQHQKGGSWSRLPERNSTTITHSQAHTNCSIPSTITMSAMTGKDNLSGSPEQASPEQAGTPTKNSSKDETISGSIRDDGSPREDFNQHVRPLTGIAKFMADHSSDEYDPMTMGQIGLVGPGLQEDNEEYDEATRNLPGAVAYDESFTTPQQQVVASKCSSSPVDLSDECYPGDAEQREKTMEKANQCAPRFGYPKSFVRIIHVNGETLEVPKSDKTPCDKTCPTRKTTFMEKLLAASGSSWGRR
ncbi:hypothetical protein CERZMDRAFT_93141 [Cercospora zeae-maydis SCOH1-5]|uniref:Uncharacterized protein n=1 Tax=Cercospora zeae-maydis SCOH1-5 TaxID=717836 RepID=A0A6A6FUZ4_9PEZI|nr:hypothetical protein CERZMDRAFT_93141 [Cercospora zeae-maydis SCOH1-5]